MDVLVMLEEAPEHSPVLAHVNSVPSSHDADHASRDVVTLYGVPSPESLALALAAAVESHRAVHERSSTIRHLGVWPERGAVGDAAWRDGRTGQLMTQDVDIPFDTLREVAKQILSESGQAIRRLVAGLMMPDWPEGTGRAINLSFFPAFAGAPGRGEAMLDAMREADALAYDTEEN